MVHLEMSTLSHGLSRTLPLAVGVWLGAQLGAYFSHRMNGAWIIRGLALALGVVGVRILIGTFHLELTKILGRHYGTNQIRQFD